MSIPVCRTAIVLSGGGTRGAYEAGVVQGLVEVLGLGADDPAPFDAFTGTSVGALNAAFLAGSADRGDMAVHRLADLWTSLSLGVHARLDRRALWKRAMLDVAPLEALVRGAVDFDRLDGLIEGGVVRALVVAALHVGTGRTAMFAHTAPGVSFRPSRDPARVGISTRITADHVLASAAIPMIFPPREVEGQLFYDGGLRFNTPLSPAIRTGADRIVVVSPLYRAGGERRVCASIAELGGEGESRAPGALFLAGKMLNALLLDPITHDLEVLERFNRMVEMVEATVTPVERARIGRMTTELRGQPYRRLDVLALSPSQDIGAMATEFLRLHRRRLSREGVSGRLLAWAAGGDVDTDLMSYLLFDAEFTRQLITLGVRDAHARADDIRAFFPSAA